MTTGILLIAVGHKNYGQLVGTLAASIRANGCELPITLACQKDTITRLTKQYLDLFTEVIEVPEHCYTLNGETCYIKTKAHMNELSTYDNTLFLDSDIIMMNNGMINTIIEDLKDVEFTIKNSGFTAYDSEKITSKSTQWANLLEVKKAYEFTSENIWNVHSEFVWWKKTEKTKQLFDLWIETFETLKVEHTQFGGCIPDELPLWIAMCLLGIEPHKNIFHPIFWPMESKEIKRIKDLKDYVGLSIGGNVIAPVQENNYNILAKLYSKILNLSQTFTCQPKKRWLPERHTY